VDLFGLPADYDPIQTLAEDHGLFVLEDAAQSFGATYRGRRAGSLGDVAATSFYPAKPLGCYGDGGAVFTDDDGLAQVLRSIRVHGQGVDQYDNVRVGLNARMDTLQAAILLPKLAALPEELDKRARVARYYTEQLGAVLETPVVPSGSDSAWAQYSILVDDRSRVQERLRAAGIPSAIYYRTPLHLQDAFRDLGYRPGDLPVCEGIAHRILSLPMHPYLSEDQLAAVTGAVLDAVQG
jgi:UDP-2-acetamido-2-deoxy-ribo-hexuluronate aminotransferase